MVWHDCAGPVKVRKTLLALLLASGWMPWS